ncbi:4-hydroxybenzoate octaprenyltransferase [Hyphobacterium marinum]|uniref:4-hydroxybenzoate octaprenyltransferase n=1 Tax=Hyphobacterium marinum TaxID=3116574 RepID=A0ABU7LWZ0_9PROT|nr:4-hydroxybenzoate octaprenyltransferase [Hyphobacterium sp. Y6023]MEE2565996.1 4-hydroxybenzoate octaprenyltransferase [Hyphobacterium sp. Y6023]
MDRAPARIRPFLRLARYDRPIGFWLLAIPCWQGLLLANIGGPGLGWPDLELAALLTLGAIAMRGAGCTYNDIVDRDLDARVERTRDRPLAAGTVSLQSAWLFLLAQCLVGFVVLVQLPPIAIGIGLAALALVAAYPFMKRITWWPQAWLGLTFNWGILVAYAAVTGGIDTAAVLLYVSGFFWTLGYDTIYACQDMEDDALVGVRSTARALQGGLHAWLWGFYLAAALLAAAAILVQGPTPWFVGLFALYAYYLFDQIRRTDPDKGAACLAVFKSNQITGLLLTGALFLACII